MSKASRTAATHRSIPASAARPGWRSSPGRHGIDRSRQLLANRDGERTDARPCPWQPVTAASDCGNSRMVITGVRGNRRDPSVNIAAWVRRDEGGHAAFPGHRSTTQPDHYSLACAARVHGCRFVRCPERIYHVVHVPGGLQVRRIVGILPIPAQARCPYRAAEQFRRAPD